MDWIYLADLGYDINQLRAHVNTLISPGSIKCLEILEKLNDLWLVKKMERHVVGYMSVQDNASFL
jgi:hypothetical protein